MVIIRTGASRTVRGRYIVEIEFYTDSETSVTVISEHITNNGALEKVEKIVAWCKSVSVEYEVDVL